MLTIFDKIGRLLDSSVEQSARSSARLHGRRSALAKIGGFVAGGLVISVLPFDRAWGSPTPVEKEGDGDDTSCDYWRYCALDGNLCTTMGGSTTSCPVGAEASEVSWVGTCHNPGDERDYLVSYYDCCGKTGYSEAQFCLRSEGERPAYSMGLHNDINWCMANANKGYHCTVALIVGVAE
ncbi:methylamine dehydrogenase light chain [Hirschia baltica]|uniref:Aralkylamine dehydrogenase n=1 Tax=Hirschia baltica (strain ATCC 49814 / DSM 5838 / IFAM 1418) TaxID=582402 RepID=C6XQB1_HIRBI|nr:methylamine dehydrogenase light chain [Hirschia baltica]ACT60410.1 Aralkylamine dehydrogenase [Hirschia baltica ATCC 49814]